MRWSWLCVALFASLMAPSIAAPVGRVLGSYSISDLNVWNAQPFFLKIIQGSFPQTLIASISTGLSGPERVYNVRLKQNLTGGLSFDVSAAGKGKVSPSLTQAPWTINQAQSRPQWSTLSRSGAQLRPKTPSKIWPPRQGINAEQTTRFLDPNFMKVGPNLGGPRQSAGPAQPSRQNIWHPPIQDPVTVMRSPIGTDKPPRQITSSIVDSIFPKKKPTQSVQSIGDAVPPVMETTPVPQKAPITTQLQTTTTTAPTTTTTAAMRLAIRPKAPPPTPRPTGTMTVAGRTTVDPLLDPEGYAEMYFTEGPDPTDFPFFSHFGRGTLFGGFPSFPFMK